MFINAQKPQSIDRIKWCILCASAEEGHDGKVEPLRPPKDSQPGDLVYIGDLPREPVADKKCPWSKVAKDLKVNENLQATYKGELVWRIASMLQRKIKLIEKIG